MHVYTSCGVEASCGDGASTLNGITTFEMNYNAYNTANPQGGTCQSNGNCTDSITPRVTQFIVRVTRAVPSSPTTCSAYTVRITNQ
jgi:hypothetical protein